MRSYLVIPGLVVVVAAIVLLVPTDAGGCLRAHRPLEDRTDTLGEPDAERWRASSNGRHAIRFECDDAAVATAMVIDPASRFMR